MRKQGYAVRHPCLVAGVIRVVGKAVKPGDVAEFAELRIIADSEDDMPVGRGKGLIGNDVRMCVAKAPGRSAADHIVQRLVGEAGDADIKQAHIDMLAVTGARRMHNGGQNRGGGIGAGQDIDKGNADLHRHAVRLSGDAHQPAHALDHEIISGAMRIRPVLPETGDRAIDELRIDGAKRFIVEPVFRQPTDLEILDKDIAFGGEAAQDRSALGRGDVNGERALVAVDRTEIGGPCGRVGICIAGHLVDEGRAPATCVVAGARTLDLDDIGAKVTQHLGGPGAGKDS